MVSPRRLPFMRQRRNSTQQKNRKGARLPSPLRLESSFFREQTQRDPSMTGPPLKAVRGSISGPSENKENKGNKDYGPQEVPVKMKVPLAQAAWAREEPVEKRPVHAEPVQPEGPSQSDHHQRPDSAIIISKQSSLRPPMQSQSVSPEESLRTILVLDSPGASDDEESDISPLSDDRRPEDRPSTASRSDAVLHKFFPELSSNTFGVVSPMSADATADQQGPHPFPSILESELQERVHHIYQNSIDSVESPSTDIDQALEHNTGSSSNSGNEDVFDCASSCYSRRTSITSVETDCFNATRHGLETYSLLSPVAAGVFDESTSARSSRAPSVSSRVPSGPTPSPVYAASSTCPASPLLPSRQTSVSSKLSINDIRNKPLPLEPVQEPSPLDIRRPGHAWPSATMEGSRSNESVSTYRHHALNHSTTSMHRKQLRGEVCYQCGGCGSGPNVSHSRRGRQPEWPRASNGQRLRQVPTLAQAAEELEYALADLARDPHMQQRTLLVLDGPLQISRHNGDLVATRPAPPPPSTKPHSKSFKKKSKTGLVDETINARSGTLKSFRTAKEKSPPSVPDKNPKHQGDLAPKDSLQPLKLPTAAGLKDEAKGPFSHSRSPSPSTDEPPRMLKERKSFTLNMPSFRRTKNSRGSTWKGPRLSVVLSSRSETSLVELDPPTSPPAQARPDGPEQLSSHSAADPHSNQNVVNGGGVIGSEVDASTASKRDDLLLQLPRLQTQDLEFRLPIELFSIEAEPLAQVQTKEEGEEQHHQQQQQQPPQPPQPLIPPPLRTQGFFASSCASETMQQGQNHQVHPALRAAAQNGNAKASTLELRITPPEDEKMLVASELVPNERLRYTQAFVSTSQASSVQLPPEQIYELAATPPSPSSSMPPMLMDTPQVPVDFPVEMPDHLVILIMERIDSLDDLFNFVLVNKHFYQIFKRRELHLIKGALFRMSPPAWELREMSPPWKNEWQFLLEPDTPLPEYTAESYLDRYASDIYALAQLKSMILVRCSPFLRRDTVKGLSGVDLVRAEEVDDAFWRIWTFCRIFGSGKGRENDLEGQMDWLKGGPKARSSFGASSTVTEPFGINNVLFEPPEGFARGNGASGLSAKQLYDMTEIWTCLGVLLQPLHGKCVEARNAGIFDGLNISMGDTVREEAALEEWTSYVLTLGLSAVLTVSSLCPAEATSVTFSKAQANGLTKWESTETGVSRSSFLKEAVSCVYEQQERYLASTSPDEMIYSQPQSTQRRKQFQEELRTRRLHGPPSREGAPGRSFADERPMSEFSTIVHNLDGTAPRDAAPVPPVPQLSYDRLSSSTASIGPRTPSRTPPRSLTPENHIPIPRSPPLQPALAPPPLRPQVQDPVDRALAYMVNQLGFNPDDVKWALKITDTGEGLDVDAAEQLLKQQKRKNERNPFAPRGKDSLLKSVMKRQGSQDSGWRFA